jgi:hypothetical protein
MATGREVAGSNQEKMEVAINSIRSELEGKIKARMDYALVAAGKQTQALREEVNQKLGETQQDIQASIRSLQGDITDLKTELETRMPKSKPDLNWESAATQGTMPDEQSHLSSTGPHHGQCPDATSRP